MTMTQPPCDTTLLEQLRRRALAAAAGSDDPLVRQQFSDLAQSYAETATELRDHGAAVMPSPDLTRMPWRSVPLWITNDQ
ncbi:hypothetical protein [Sphingomonas sp. Root710]|uniref:hypothetical protein n=1 Tax=Sphingomonas sp. Root710 TaxID=1736594 RepID=UPI00138F64E9|nr:hypothetical protein [Sphingomonas sp. Root710]